MTMCLQSPCDYLLSPSMHDKSIKCFYRIQKPFSTEWIFTQNLNGFSVTVLMNFISQECKKLYMRSKFAKILNFRSVLKFSLCKIYVWKMKF